MLALMVIRNLKPRKARELLLALCLPLGFWLACGASRGGTAAGTYYWQITGTWSSSSHKDELTLTVE
ncbi:MAG: hypothetical protein DMG22_15540 [Acidobacteria bacterium]|nr:MAG: hypothetical protein DMG22_15540 [Acidobacteriota bacterium]